MGTMPAAQGLAGQVDAITATTLVTTNGAVQQSTVTSIVHASSGTAKASSTSTGIVQQTGNAAVRGSLINAGVVAGAVFGAATYVL